MLGTIVVYPEGAVNVWLRAKAAMSKRRVDSFSSVTSHTLSPLTARTERTPDSPPARRSDMHCAVSNP